MAAGRDERTSLDNGLHRVAGVGWVLVISGEPFAGFLWGPQAWEWRGNGGKRK